MHILQVERTVEHAQEAVGEVELKSQIQYYPLLPKSQHHHSSHHIGMPYCYQNSNNYS